MEGQQTGTRDETRFGQMLQEYGPRLRSAIARICPHGLGIHPEDIEQEVRLRLWRATQAERTIEHPASYLQRAAASATIDAIRRLRARREEPLGWTAGQAEEEAAFEPPASADPSPERAAAQSEALEAVQAALGGLAPNRRDAVGLHLQGFTTEEIAELLGWTEPKARNLVHRGLRDLRAALRAKGIDHETL